jgi:2-methylcitrate dehydratase PrpD
VTADPEAFDQWLSLMDAAELELGGPPIPGGLAVKQWPCCYALQRPIAAARMLGGDPGGRIAVRAPATSTQPLNRDRPRTGLEGKFSLRYGIAAALLDGDPGFESFSDAGVARPEAHALMDRIDVELTPGGDGLLSGEITIGDVTLADVPPPDLEAKRALCGAGGAGPNWEERQPDGRAEAR